MMDRGTTFLKEALDLLELRLTQGTEETEAKGLRQRRVRAVEHGVDATHLRPGSLHLRLKPGTRLDEGCVGRSFGTLQAACESLIRKGVRRSDPARRHR
jgi:hypothetical protein